ncbi:hypothetical protein M0R45_002335 [Rubus argutus]|uniref:Uncharacterized protein n=1 Tax=Rubus argutus TaxID=59490 RepID=A0AAW1VE96_RUBAR
MANSLFIPNHSFIVAPSVPVSFSSKPIAPPQSILGFSFPNSSSITIRTTSSSGRASSFKSQLAPRESVPPANAKEDQDVEASGADQQHLPSLRTLLKVHKDAIFNGDEKTIRS